MLNKIQQGRFSAIFMLLFTMSNAYGNQAHVNVANKALLIGVDGVQLERMQALHTPNFDRLHILKAFTGGVKGKASEQRTVSGPGWSTILSGVWANKHHIRSNGDGASNPRWPSIFRYIHEKKTHAKLYSFSTWKPIHDQYFARDMPLLTDHAEGGKDPDFTQKALNVLKTAYPDFMFLYLEDPDNAGHAYGFGREYDEAILNSDKRIGALMDAVELRERSLGENWLVIVTTDHGRDATGKGHGNQTTSEKTIFIASNKRLVQTQGTYASYLGNEFEGLYHTPAQTFIVPTLLKHLGVFTDRHWGLD